MSERADASADSEPDGQGNPDDLAVMSIEDLKAHRDAGDDGLEATEAQR